MSCVTLFDVRALISWMVLLLVGLVAAPALAFAVPPIQGHVTDTAGKLSSEDRLAINLRLQEIQRASGNHVVVFLAGSLAGSTIDDVAYETFQAWKIGEKGLDNGVLLVIAPNERKIRIETGRGVGSEITDVDAAAIISLIKPPLKGDRFREAILAGADAIEAKLTGRFVQKPSAANGSDFVLWSWLLWAALAGAIGAAIYWVARRLVRAIADSPGWTGGSGSSSWSSGSSSSSYSSSSYDSGSSSYSSSSSSDSSSYGGYDGGGGSSGGGGASDSY